MATIQTIHGIVEQMALAAQQQSAVTSHIQRLRRTATPLVGLLKGQFGSISDQVAAMILAATRGASDKMRVRALRENVASIRMHLDVAQKRVLETHAAPDEKPPDDGVARRPLSQ